MRPWRSMTLRSAVFSAVLALVAPWLLAAPSGLPMARRSTTVPVANAVVPVPPQPLDIVSQRVARLPSPSVPPSAGPASGQVGVVFTSAQTGYLAAVPEPQTSGYAGGAMSELERTTNGGASWAVLWRGRGVVLHWVATAGGAVVAAGLGARGPLLVESTDGGATWREVPVAISLPAASVHGAQANAADWYWATSALYFLNQRVGFAYPNAMYGQMAALPGVILRTTDGGRQWATVRFEGGSPSGGLVFVGAKDGFATGLSALTPSGSEPPGCTSQIWQTTDEGASWQAVPGTCAGYLLSSLCFPTSQVGYAGGGNYAKFSLVPQLALLATADGGRHWSVVFTTPKSRPVPGGGYGGPFGELHFYDPTQGLALAGGCTMGANGPCLGQVWWTADGGRSWSPVHVEGSQLVVAGRSGAWVGGGPPEYGNVLWHSGDRGRSWVPVASPGKAWLSGFLAAGGRLWVSTEAGQFMSVDGGQSWQHVTAGTLAAEGSVGGGQVAELGASGLVVVQTGTDRVWVSDDGGRSGHVSHITGIGAAGASAVSFAGDEDGLALSWGSCAAFKPVTPPISFPLRPTAVVVTHDGGATWRKVATIDVAGYGGLAYGGSLAVAAATCTKGLATSTDAGRTWRYWRVPSNLTGCQQPSISAGTVVVYCPSYTAGHTTLRLLVSEDAGQHWSVFKLRGPGAQDVQGTVASGPGVLWAFGQATGDLWRSTDGGATWRQVELALPLLP